MRRARPALTPLGRALALVREVFAAARAQPVSSLVTISMVAGLCAAVFLTTGRTVAAEKAALSQIDAVGTRLIVVRTQTPDVGLDAAVLDRLRGVDGIEMALGFGEAVDAQNGAFPGGTLVPVRLLYGPLAGVPAPVGEVPGVFTAYASDAAAGEAGLADDTGGLVTTDNRQVNVVGTFTPPSHLAFLEPLILIPEGAAAESAEARTTKRPLTVLVVVPTSPDLVAPVTAIVQDLIAVDDPRGVSMSTSKALADVRAAIEGHLGTYGRALVLGILGIGAVLIAANLYGLVTSRRKDFGRRRALGASRGLIVALVLAQVSVLSASGALLGSAVALGVLGGGGDPLPPASFVVGVGVLAIATGLLAAAIPALIAARRDPIKELRVP